MKAYDSRKDIIQGSQNTTHGSLNKSFMIWYINI